MLKYYPLCTLGWIFFGNIQTLFLLLFLRHFCDQKALNSFFFLSFSGFFRLVSGPVSEVLMSWVCYKRGIRNSPCHHLKVEFCAMFCRWDLIVHAMVWVGLVHDVCADWVLLYLSYIHQTIVLLSFSSVWRVVSESYSLASKSLWGSMLCWVFVSPGSWSDFVSEGLIDWNVGNGLSQFRFCSWSCLGS